MKEMGMLRMLTDRPVFRYIPPVWMLSLLALMALRLPVSAAEFFAFLAMTGIVLGPYLLYEAQHVVVRALGWIVTLLSVIGIGYFTWGFVYGELTIPKVRPTWILLGITVVLPFVLAIGREFQSDMAAKAAAAKLSVSLDEYAKECLSRMRTARPAGKQNEEEWRQRTEYLTKFKTAIIRIHNHFVISGLSFRGVEDSYLGGGPSASLDTFDLSKLTSKLMHNFGGALPYWQRWFSRRFYFTMGLGLSLAILVWILLFAVGEWAHK
jgi:hypothetical protein